MRRKDEVGEGFFRVVSGRGSAHGEVGLASALPSEKGRKFAKEVTRLVPLVDGFVGRDADHGGLVARDGYEERDGGRRPLVHLYGKTA